MNKPTTIRSFATAVLLFALSSCVQDARDDIPPTPPKAATPKTDAPKIETPTLQQAPSTKEVPFAAEPTISLAGGENCQVGAVTVLKEIEEKDSSVGIGFGPKGGIAAWPEGKKRLRVMPLSSLGASLGVGELITLPSLSPVVLVEPVNDRYVVGTEGYCRELGDGNSSKCVHYVGVDADGKPHNSPDEFLTHMSIISSVTTKETPADAPRLFLWSYLYMPSQVVSLQYTPEHGVRADELFAISLIKRSNESYSFGRALAARRNRWFAVFENPSNGAFLLDNTGDKVPLTWISPRDYKNLWEGFPWRLRVDGDDLALIYESERDYERDNDRDDRLFARFSLDGSLIGKVQKLSPEAPPPAPFADELNFALSTNGKEIQFERRNAAGKLIGVPISIGPAEHEVPLRSHPYRVAWTGNGFVVIYVAKEKKQTQIRTVHISCDPGSSQLPAAR